MKTLQPSRVFPLKKLRRRMGARKELQTICFKHRVNAKVCHCNSPNCRVVNSGIRIPARNDDNGWKALYDYFYPKTVSRWAHQDDPFGRFPKPGTKRQRVEVKQELPKFPRLK